MFLFVFLTMWPFEQVILTACSKPLLTVFLHLFLKCLNAILFCYYHSFLYISPLPHFLFWMLSPRYGLDISSVIPATINLLMSTLILSMFQLHMLMRAYYNFQEIGFVHIPLCMYSILAVDGSRRNLLVVD
jgi:hypothetical protein